MLNNKEGHRLTATALWASSHFEKLYGTEMFSTGFLKQLKAETETYPAKNLKRIV